MRVIIVAHGHPTLHKGGGEVAAHALHRMLRAEGHLSVFVGWGGQSHSPHGGGLTNIGQDDYLLFTESEHFRFSSLSDHLHEALSVLMEAYQPDVVHFHHYLHIGIEAASLVKKLRPKTRVLLTLHEYLAICANNGQLFTRTNEVCEGYAPERCAAKCFPQHRPAAFFMREIALKSALGFVDDFIAPSMFLAGQYIAWGIPTHRMTVVENPLFLSPPTPGTTASRIKNIEEELKIGFFGQINFYKGLDIVLEGVRLAHLREGRVTLGIHGNFSEVTADSYIENLKASITAMGAVVCYHGTYIQAEVQALMENYHFVVMGSRWYENSPVVIQEAINAGTPLIVPNHGGMAEKAAGVGLLYRPGDASNLSAVLENITQESFQQLKAAVWEKASWSESSRNDHLKKVLALYA